MMLGCSLLSYREVNRVGTMSYYQTTIVALLAMEIVQFLLFSKPSFNDMIFQSSLHREPRAISIWLMKIYSLVELPVAQTTTILLYQ